MSKSSILMKCSGPDCSHNDKGARRLARDFDRDERRSTKAASPWSAQPSPASANRPAPEIYAGCDADCKSDAKPDAGPRPDSDLTPTATPRAKGAPPATPPATPTAADADSDSTPARRQR